jgi:hypothetical protein
MKAYLIDPEAEEIREAEYNGDFKEISKVLGPEVRVFDAARFNEHGDAVFVDDEGLLKQPEYFFLITGYPSPLAGRGFVLGCDLSTGESCSPSVSLRWLEENVSFLRRLQC